MVECLLLCQVSVVGMKRLSPLVGISVHKLPRDSNGVGLLFRRKASTRRRLKLVVTAELSHNFAAGFSLDSQSFQFHDASRSPWVGPVPGDIAEVEAYCRIFRAVERLHAAVMDTLCNPSTGECMVSYDFTAEERPLVEDKIVSVLGCMLSLLNKGRESVLSGRLSTTNTFQEVDVSLMEDKLPPLAVFRNEMKRCCESLHIALENYLTPDDNRSLNVWRKLQRLKNICYDSGFPREENHPCHSLFANWEPIYLSTSKEQASSKESEVAFCKGGQVTEEGLKWLIDQGYGIIVDLRAETVKDNFYEAAVHDAVMSGKLELIKIPVEVGTAPSMNQVEQFASLVSDCSKKPIYLHSKEGARRTSAMISRWRQYMTRFSPHLVLNQYFNGNDVLSDQTNGTGKIKRSATSKEGIDEENKFMQQTLDSVPSRDAFQHKGVTSDDCSNDLTISEAKKDFASGDAVTAVDAIDNEKESVRTSYQETDPLKAQVPPCNVFSRKEMSIFLRSTKVSPNTYFDYQYKRLEELPISKEISFGTPKRNFIIGTDPFQGHIGTGKLSGSFIDKTKFEDHPVPAGSNGKYVNGAGIISVSSDVTGLGERKRYVVTETDLSTSSKNFDKNTLQKSPGTQKYDGKPASVSSGDELGSIEGNMCASATGVVRVQSRKKAEMFLVRTDGFSCTRERVTEASLAFTHPSTQQQMLMWKSTPKTVLLLKKLGQELMEEAKEVASFLYYQEKMNVLVEPDVHDIFARIPGFGFVQTFYTQDTSELHERVDFVACLGGDGVILHASNLFRGPVPPVVSFNLGSLGFLTSHNFDDYRHDLRQVIHGNNTADGVYITLRMRLRCEIFRNDKAVPGKVFDVLNEIVVDRGSNPYLSKIECYEHDRLITKVQGDGVIIATPTGSTAYSTAAGGSMVHPNVPCMLFTPICPHSLSFRPVILPDSARLELKIPIDARSNAWVSFDGKRRQQLSRGDAVTISMSQHPIPTVNKCDQTGDWFHSLIRCLNWNERQDQKAL